jgi:hypothetical protein
VTGNVSPSHLSSEQKKKKILHIRFVGVKGINTDLSGFLYFSKKEKRFT